MFSRYKLTRLVLGVTLGMAFFGCVGLPRRRPPTENTSPSPLARNRARNERVAPPPPLQIPSDPVPVEPAPQATSQPPTQPAPQPPPPPAPQNTTQTPPQPAPERLVQERKTAPPPAGELTPAENLAALRKLHSHCVQRHEAMNSYIVKLTRREMVGKKQTPEEVMLFKYRKQPRSVYFKWIGPHGEGREAIYVEGKYDGKLHTLTAAGDVPFTGAGKRIALSPDSMLVRANSRHSITQAGVGTLIDRFGRLIAAMEKGDTTQGTLTHLGKVKRAEFCMPIEGVEWKIPPRVDPSLPKGGRRWCYVDPECSLPALIITHDERGQEVEYYRYDRYLFPANLDDADFDPDLLWGKQK
jgi:Protein of unknown function (DUF1571)